VTLSRELSLPEIELCSREGVELEVFGHGALCFCYSGVCLYSSFFGGRSANRGLCAQPCRLPHELVDEHGETICAPGRDRPPLPQGRMHDRRPRRAGRCRGGRPQGGGSHEGPRVRPLRGLVLPASPSTPSRVGDACRRVRTPISIGCSSGLSTATSPMPTFVARPVTR
jgi:hypothetical protein